MSILDGDDGKAYPFARRILGDEFQKLVGAAFAQEILKEASKDEPVIQLMDTMFNRDASELPQHIQEVFAAIRLLESQPVEPTTTTGGDAE